MDYFLKGNLGRQDLKENNCELCRIRKPQTDYLLTFKMGEGSNHAIVFGASGLIGWALVDRLLDQVGSFSKVTAVTNRPLDLSVSHWPEPGLHRPDLQLVSGFDLRHGDGATLADSLKRAVKDIGSVTHIYYLGMSPRSMTI